MFAGGESENSSYATVGAKCPVACERASDPADRAIGIPSGTQRRLELARRLWREISRHDMHADRCAKSRRELGAATSMKEGTANERVPIQLAQCRFPGVAISSAKMQKYIFQIKCKEATLSNGTRKLFWSEIKKKKTKFRLQF